MKNRLFRVCFLVRPTVGHPSAAKFSQALLFLFLFAETSEEAAEKACDIVSALPYEPEEDRTFVSHGTFPARPGTEELAAVEQHHIEIAWDVGLSMMLYVGKDGADAGTVFRSLTAE